MLVFIQAGMAQMVAHLIGSEEVTGSIPVGSLKPETGVISVSGIFFLTANRMEENREKSYGSKN